MIHNVKTFKEPFEKILKMKKSFDIQKISKDFSTNDVIIFQEFDIDSGFTGRQIARRISYVQHGTNDNGIIKGFCVISFE